MARQLAEAGQATIEKLLEVAIRLEAAAGRFYEGLAERFAQWPESRRSGGSWLPMKPATRAG